MSTHNLMLTAQRICDETIVNDGSKCCKEHQNCLKMMVSFLKKKWRAGQQCGPVCMMSVNTEKDLRFRIQQAYFVSYQSLRQASTDTHCYNCRDEKQGHLPVWRLFLSLLFVFAGQGALLVRNLCRRCCLLWNHSHRESPPVARHTMLPGITQ